MAKPDRKVSRTRPPLGSRRMLIVAIAAVSVAAVIALRITPASLIPDSSARLTTTLQFFSAALTPALDYETEPPPGTPSLIFRAMSSMFLTVKFAVIGVSISICVGAMLGFIGSDAWRQRFSRAKGARRTCAKFIFALCRAAIAFTRSIHELIWALILLAALGTVEAVAVVAMAIPYSGTFGKVFSEMIDESPDSVPSFLAATGGSRSQVIIFGLVPGAFSDLIAYTMYRLECGLRSAAVMGFLGIPTLGYYIKLSFENIHFHEVWTFLYSLGILVVAFDFWGDSVRRSLNTTPNIQADG